MTKDQKNTVAEYASSLNDDDLRFLASRLNEKLYGDMPEALNAMSKNSKIDGVLSSAVSGEELFTICDQVRDVLIKECKKRGVSVRYVPAHSAA